MGTLKSILGAARWIVEGLWLFASLGIVPLVAVAFVGLCFAVPVAVFILIVKAVLP